MYKKITGIALVTIMAIGVYTVTNANAANDNNETLEDLLKVNVANAECKINGSGITGGCIGGMPGNEQWGECYWDKIGSMDCIYGS
jgi:hypothetical protein